MPSPPIFRHPGLDQGSRFQPRKSGMPDQVRHDDGSKGARIWSRRHLRIAMRFQLARQLGPARLDDAPGGERSEEHTSELQSLMRISYAVFCLKKKKKQHNKTSITIPNKPNKEPK